MFSLDWDKGLLQATMVSLDDKQEKKSEPFMIGYVLCLFPTPSKASPSAFPEGRMALHPHAFHLPLAPIPVCLWLIFAPLF